MCSADDQTDCAAIATDAQGDDISSSIQYATSNPTCPAADAGDLSCPLCAVQYMQQGLCLPGRSANQVLLSLATAGRCHVSIPARAAAASQPLSTDDLVPSPPLAMPTLLHILSPAMVIDKH